MKKILYLFAAATLVLASCSKENEVLGDLTENNGDVAVSFADPYLGTTRATVIETGNFDNFGVYAYEQGSIGWDTYRSSNVYPNFFYNQKVTKQSDGSWTYNPVKYFSNNTGAKHSFFAYAPYNESNNAIFSMANDAPVIRYTAKEDYDLLWAPAIVDQEKPGVNTKLAFHFQHALSKVTFDVAPFVDEVHGTTHPDGTVAAGTTITVRSVKFIGKVPSQGLLNLRDGKWTIEATEEGAYEITEPKSFTATDATRKNLISNMMVIPASDVKIKVVYDVTTADPTNPKNNSTVTNTIESVETFTLAKGTAYTFHLDLGLTSVKFTADVDTWTSAPEQNVDLPNNVDLAAAKDYTYTGADAYTYVGTITIAGNNVTATYPSTATDQNKLYDLARFIGALYRAGGVQEIVYNGVKYHWNTEGTLHGSNWEDASGNTLVSTISAAYQATPFTTLTLKCNGVDITFNIVTE